MSMNTPFLVVCLIAGLLAAGCGGGDVPRPRPIPVTRDVVQEVCSFLEGYSKGQPVGSERQLFDAWVDQIRARDPSLADLLGPGLRDIAKSPSAAKAVAIRLLPEFRAGASKEARPDDVPRSP